VFLFGAIAAVADDEPRPDAPAAPPGDAQIDARAEKIVQAMKTAHEQLAQRDAGEKTQTLQKSILAELDELLKTPPQQPPSDSPMGGGGQSGSSGGKSSSQRDASSSPQDQRTSSGTGQSSTQRPIPGTQRDRRDAVDAEERTGPARNAEIAAARRRRLEVDVWGHLPEHLREQLLNTYGEKMVPQYEQLVRKFYEALSEPPERERR
jgi:hypothetical protein